jgi:hypothetical protein
MASSLPPPPPRPSDDALQYTHSGGRYLLGYGEGYVGIWERAGGQAPVERYPRTPDGWRSAWRRYVALEPQHTEVGLGSAAVDVATAPSAPPTSGSGRDARAARPDGHPTSPAWWLLPILMGWLGGVIAWLMIRDQHPARARAMLVTGIAATIVWFAIYVSTTPVPSG